MITARHRFLADLTLAAGGGWMLFAAGNPLWVRIFGALCVAASAWQYEGWRR